MRHPMAWGVLLGFAHVLATIFFAPLDTAGAYAALTAWLDGASWTGEALALGAAVGLSLGALLVSLPGRLRRHRAGAAKAPVSPKACLEAFLGGAALLLGAGLAGGGLGFQAWGAAAAGALSGWVALLAAGLAAWAAARLSLGRKGGRPE